MTEILVERHWDDALTEADLMTAFGNAAVCLNIHRVDWSGSLLSADGHDLFCHFSAADAESVRIALQQSGSPRGLVWAGTVHDAPDFAPETLAAANIVAFWSFDTPAAPDQVQAIEVAGAPALLAYGVRHVRTYISADCLRAAGLYQASGVEAVSRALADAKRQPERVWAFRQFRPLPAENNAGKAIGHAFPRWLPRWVQRLVG